MMNYKKFTMWSYEPTALSVGYDGPALFWINADGLHRNGHHQHKQVIAVDDLRRPRFIKGVPPLVQATVQKWGVGAPYVQSGEVASAMTVGKYDFALIYCPATDSLRLVHRYGEHGVRSLLLIRPEGIYRYRKVLKYEFEFAPTDSKGRLEILR